MVTTNLTAQWGAVQAAPMLYLASAFALIGVTWIVFRYIHSVQLDNLKGQVDTAKGIADGEKRDADRLRIRLVEQETAIKKSAERSEGHKNLEVWSRRFFDPCYAKVMEVYRNLAATDPWNDANLKRRMLASIKSESAYVPSDKVSHADTLEVGQNFFLDILRLYEDCATNVHDVRNYAVPQLDLKELEDYDAWRAMDTDFVRELRTIAPTFPILNKHIGPDWGVEDRERDWALLPVPDILDELSGRA